MRQSLVSSEIMQDIVPVYELSRSSRRGDDSYRGSENQDDRSSSKKMQSPMTIENFEDGAETPQLQVFEDNKSNLDQARIENRQIRNIYKMMNQGDPTSQKRRQASPFLNYALDQYNVNLEDVPSEHEGFESSDRSTSHDNAESYVEKVDNVDVEVNNIRTEVSPDNKGKGNSELNQIVEDQKQRHQKQLSFGGLLKLDPTSIKLAKPSIVQQ